jgi:uncharacterized membrane-anchored protein
VNAITPSASAIWLNKVPEATLVFWAIKILSTTVGETGADYLAVHVGLGTSLTGAITASLLVTVLGLQLRSRQYVPWIYWLTVVSISVVGTQVTDMLTDKLEVSLFFSTVVFTALLVCTFATWYARQKTLSIHSIHTREREAFYWTAILFTFALGTASGDLATEALGLGFTWGVIIFSMLIAFIFGAWVIGLNPVLAFWLAYVLTRPLGASLGDLLSQPRMYGRAGLGTQVTSLVFLLVIAILVGLLTIRPRLSVHNISQ